MAARSVRRQVVQVTIGLYDYESTSGKSPVAAGEVLILYQALAVVRDSSGAATAVLFIHTRIRTLVRLQQGRHDLRPS